MTTPSRTLSSSEPVADDHRPSANSYPVERVAPRTPGSLVPNIERVRLLPLGIDASVVNISVRGVLISCRKKLGAGMAIRIVFEGNGVPPPASGKVARSLVASIGQGGEIWYHVGIAFDQPIDFECPATQTPDTTSEPDKSPAESSAESSADCSPTVPKFVNRW
jgi:hypothetical protein